MSTDPVRGTTVRWAYADGPMAGKTFAHTFGTDGTVRWTDAAGTAPHERPDGAAGDTVAPYEVERMNDDVYVVSYLSKAGFTLTTVVDRATGTVVSFASNGTHLSKHRGRIMDAPAG